jgi:hypothetical protein
MFHKVVIDNTGVEDENQNRDDSNRKVPDYTTALDETVRHVPSV